MQIAIDAAGFSPGEADRLRQAMGSKRSRTRMAAMRERLLAGNGGNAGSPASRSGDCSQARSLRGLRVPESHSVSFAYLVYASAWLKRHYPASFTAALLNSQPWASTRPTRSCETHPPRRGRSSAPASTRHVATAPSSPHSRRRTEGISSSRLARRRVDARGAGRPALLRGSPTGCWTASTRREPSSPSPTLEDFTRRTGPPSTRSSRWRRRERSRLRH